MKLVLSVLTLSLMTTAAFARGTESSGGGPSIYCDLKQDFEPEAYVYDLVEGRARHGFDIPEGLGSSPEAIDIRHRSVDQHVDAALKKLATLDYGTAVEARRIYRKLLTQIKFLPKGILMEYPTDLGSGEASIVERGCRLVYAAFYEDRGVLRISDSLYNSPWWTNRDRAALLTHETLYLLARQRTKQTDSRSTRLLNAFLYAKDLGPNQEVRDSIATMIYDGWISPTVVFKGTREIDLKVSCPKAAHAGYNPDQVLYMGRIYFYDVLNEQIDLYGKNIPRNTPTFVEIPKLEVKGTPSISSVTLPITEYAAIGKFSIIGYADRACTGQYLEVWYQGKHVGNLAPDMITADGRKVKPQVRFYSSNDLMD